MAFTFTPLVANDPILSADFMEKIKDLQTYINGGMSSADITGTFDKHHIMKGSYNVLTNTSSFVSGICGGQGFTSVEQKLSFVPGGATQPTSGEPQRVYYPSTTLSFYVEKRSVCLFQFFAHPLMYKFGLSTTVTDQREGTLNIVIDDVTWHDTVVITHEEWWATYPQMRQREPMQGFQIIELAEGWHSIGLQGYTTSHNVMLINWGFSLETWHDDSDINS